MSLFIMLTFAQLIPVHAHGVKQVRKELTEQGYTDIEFQRRKPPFKLDACLKDDRHHLHVDYYGKIIKKSIIGSCGSASSDEDEPNGNTSVASETETEPESNETVSDEGAARAFRRWGVDIREPSTD